MSDDKTYTSRHGNHSGYVVEFRLTRFSALKWKQMPTIFDPQGVKSTSICKYVDAELGILCYEQAMALAWAFLAERRSDPHWERDIEVRVRTVNVTYDLKSTFSDDKPVSIGSKP